MKYKYTALFLLLFLSLTSCTKTKQVTPEKGVSSALAVQRKAQVLDVVYNLQFHIPKTVNAAISANLILETNLAHVNTNVVLDFNEDVKLIQSVVINGKTVAINHVNEHLVLMHKYLKKGQNTIKIEFKAGDLSLNRNDDFLYTLLVPDRASTLFPCFDQPDIKATYNLEITAPKTWQVLAGGVLKNKVINADTTTHIFKTTDTISTYLFSFVAGRFKEVVKPLHGFNSRFLFRETNAEKLAESIEPIYNIHQKSLDFLEAYTNKKFPFQKLDFAAIPAFQYGGMEHVGAIQYKAASLFLDKNATTNKQLSRAKLIAHEVAHMWFGNLVTMAWFNDVWLKEVFANFMANKIVNPLYPEVNHNLSFMMAHYPSAYSEDRTQGTNPIRQKLDNLKNAGSLYGRIIYNKAPIMMRQLELLVGKTAFKKSMQTYIKRYANANATWEDLVAILDKNSTENLKKWSAIWVNTAGRPIFYEAITKDKNGAITNFNIRQKAEDGSDAIWQQSFTITLINKNGLEKDVYIKNIKEVFDITNVIKTFKPVQILYNTDGLGYGVFPVNKAQITNFKTIENPVSRGYQYINLYENMLLGKVPVTTTAKVFFNAIKVEKNELILSYLSARLKTLFWSFFTDKSRQVFLDKIEAPLFDLLQNNTPTNLKRTLFSLYRSVAYNAQGVENLHSIWSKKITITNLFLNENDSTNLAMALAVFKHPQAKTILEAQQKNIQNKDRLARFIWLLPALSADVKQRDAFMNTLLLAKHRTKESWVQQALAVLHHPLRQEQSIKHLEAVLNVLQEVQLTGDIFFPKAWLANSIGKYSNKAAKRILDTFLENNPNYNKNLLQKIHQTTDHLKRAVLIKE